MRIDPNQYLANTQTDSVQQANTPATQAAQSEEAREANGVEAEDQFQPSQTLDQVQRLQAQLAQTPEIRNERVAALSQKIQNGTYNPTNDQIAGAMVGDMTGGQRS